MIQKLKTLIKGGHFDGHPKKIIGALQCNIEVTIQCNVATKNDSDKVTALQ